MGARKGPQIDPREVLRAEIAALPTKKGPKGTSVDVGFLAGAYGAVIAASKARRMSLQAYMRRATLAFAAHDLGVDLDDLLRFDSRVARETGFPIDDPEGTKFGPWEIERLAGEAPDGE